MHTYFLPHLSRLSRIFQKENVDLSLIQSYLKTTIDTIKEYKHTPGPNFQKVEDVLANHFPINVTTSQKEAFKSGIQVVYIQAIVDRLRARFPCVDVLGAFSIFDPDHLPSGEQDLQIYGQGKLRVLVKMFGEGDNPDIEGDECTSERESLKRLVKVQPLCFIDNVSDVEALLYKSIIA